MLAPRLRPKIGFHRASPLLNRQFSTLRENPFIHVFPSPANPTEHLLTLLPALTPTPLLALGTTSTIPPTPSTFQPNSLFLSFLNTTLSQHAPQDPDLQAQARAFVSPGGFFFLGAQHQKTRNATGLSGASGQGGAGSTGVGGWVHLSDRRNPPNFGRIAWPEDILGSVEVDGQGKIVGEFQPSGTYRLVTREGILGLSPFLLSKLKERLHQEEAKITGQR